MLAILRLLAVFIVRAANSGRWNRSRPRLEAKVFFAPKRVGGLWLPELAREIAEATAFVLLVGEKGIGAQTRAPFPEGVNAPVQYGPRIGAFVLYLLHYQLLPEKRLVELMADLLGVTLAAATIARISRDFARRFQGFANVVRDHIAAAPVKHMDETGFRIGGKTRWLHVACTAQLTFDHVCTKRGSLLANVAGIVVHDHWKPITPCRACCTPCATPITCAS